MAPHGLTRAPPGQEAPAGEQTSTTPNRAPVTTCTFCSEQFPTRSAMFRHLERPCATCPAPREDYGEKVLLIVGYDSILMMKRERGHEAGTLPPTPSPPGEGARVVGGECAAAFVLKAMGMGLKRRDSNGVRDDNGGGHTRCYASRPVGWSQASSGGCPLLSQEEEVSASADTICLRAPTTVPSEGVRAWLDETNAALKSDGLAGGAVQLLGRMTVPSTFHAEIHAKRRRYEYLLPAWMLDETAEGPWEGPPRGQEKLIPLLRRLRAKGLRPFGHCNGEHDGTRRRCPLWHNFSASALPHSPSSQRRLYRFFAMEVIQSTRPGDAGAVEGGAIGMDYVCLSINGDAFMDQQVRGMVALAVAGARGLISAEDIAATIEPTRQEDLLPVPLAPIPPCSLAEVGYSGWQMRLGVGGVGVCMSPGAQPRECLPIQGWSDEISRSEGAKFRRQVLDNSARWWEERQGGASWLRDVLLPGALKLRRKLKASNSRAEALEALEEGSSSCNQVGRRSSRDESSRSRSVNGGPFPAEELSSLKEAPAVYAKVLRLLRDVSAAGEWPTSTASRSVVILGDRGDGAGSGPGPTKQTEMTAGVESRDSEGTPAAAVEATKSEVMSAADRENAVVGTRTGGLKEPTPQREQQGGDGGGSGSFTLGAFPPPCPPPRGNRLFPELARAAFELEASLLPDRPPSTTIAVNRNARFKPHVDSGSGAGQSRSLIVGLGDYTGGELVVEGEEVDIRYRALEFNGWTQRHWTRPFSGERYTLVWFTPKGCEGVAGDARFSTAAAAAATV